MIKRNGLVIKANDLKCQKMCGGKRTLWHARLDKEDAQVIHMFKAFANDNKVLRNTIVIKACMVCGAGNTADNAIKDYQKQFREMVKTELYRARSRGWHT